MQARLAWTTLVAVATLAAVAPARADPPPATQQAPSHREVNVFPLVGGDSDVGVGGGAVGDVAEEAHFEGR